MMNYIWSSSLVCNTMLVSQMNIERSLVDKVLIAKTASLFETMSKKMSIKALTIL